MLPCAIRRRMRLRRHVDELDLVGLADDRVRDRLLLLDAGDLLDDVVDGLEVLDVQRRDDVDSRREQLLDVLASASRCRDPGRSCGRAVDERDLWLAGEIASMSISSNARPLCSTTPAGRARDRRDLLGGARAAVRLDEADDDVCPPFSPPPLVQHCEGLAHAGTAPSRCGTCRVTPPGPPAAAGDPPEATRPMAYAPKRLWTIRSISLIPTNGRIIPPSP